MNAGQRFFFALIGGAFAFGAAFDFWDSTAIGEEVSLFVVASVLLFGIACLYQRRISRILVVIGFKRPNHQLWATIGMIAFVLLIGKIAYASARSAPPNHKQESNHVQSRWNAPDANSKTAASRVESAPLAELKRSEGEIARAQSMPERTRHSQPSSQAVLPPSPQEDVPNSGSAGGKETSGILDSQRAANETGGDTGSVQPSQLASKPAVTFAPKSSATGPNPPAEPTYADKASIESACSYAKNIQGPAAYHECVNKQFAELAQQSNAPDLNGLSYSDKASIESVCSYARNVQGPASYHRCVGSQLAELAKYPNAPDLSGLSYSDKASIESACSYARNVQGPSSYHRCEGSQLEELAKYPNAPDLGGLSYSDKASIESACSYAKNVQGPASYHRCLGSQLAALGGR